MNVNLIGIDLAKSIFHLHGVDFKGRKVFQKKLSRLQMVEFIRNTPPCLIAMEACGMSNFWGRTFRAMGHEVKLIHPSFVKPFVKTNKNDASDAEAITEAAVRPSMRFVPIKETWQQDIQSLHRVRSVLVRNRVSAINEAHGLVAEYGIILSKSDTRFYKELYELTTAENALLSADLKVVIRCISDNLTFLHEQISILEEKIKNIAKNNEICERIQTVPGVGPITATAIMAAAPDTNQFKNGRQFAAYFGLVPKQFSTGGKTTLGRISKRGDSYIRTLLIHGGRSVLLWSGRRDDQLSRWAMIKKSTRGYNRTAVAIANKNARTIFAIMKSGERYQPRIAVAA